MEIWLVRHAETNSNRLKIFEGHSDGQGSDFTDLGYIQAKLLARRLSKVKFEEMIMSDLKRSVKTGEQILKLNPVKNISFSNLIRERNGGILEGKPSEVKFQMQKSSKDGPRSFKPINGESILDVFIRARRFMFDLITRNVSPYFIQNFKKYFELKQEFLLQNYQLKIEEEIRIQNLTEEERKFKYNKIMQFKQSLEMDSKLMLDDCLKSTEETIKDDLMKLEIEVDSLIDSMNSDENIKLNEYDPNEIDQYIDQMNLNEIESKPYQGFDDKSNIKRVLVISHSGFISEVINLIRKISNLKPNIKNKTNNTGIHVIRLYCGICGNDKMCEDKAECRSRKYKLEIEQILINELSHLSVLNGF